MRNTSARDWLRSGLREDSAFILQARRNPVKMGKVGGWLLSVKDATGDGK
jgi:hypothetical protein